MDRYELAIKTTDIILDKLRLKFKIEYKNSFQKFDFYDLNDIYMYKFLCKMNNLDYIDPHQIHKLIQYDFFVYFNLKILDEIKNENYEFEKIRSPKIYYLIYNDMKRNIIAKINQIRDISFKNKNIQFIIKLKKYKKLYPDNKLLNYYFFKMQSYKIYDDETFEKLYNIYFFEVVNPAVMYKSVRKI